MSTDRYSDNDNGLDSPVQTNQIGLSFPIGNQASPFEAGPRGDHAGLGCYAACFGPPI